MKAKLTNFRKQFENRFSILKSMTVCCVALSALQNFSQKWKYISCLPGCSTTDANYREFKNPSFFVFRVSISST